MSPTAETLARRGAWFGLLAAAASGPGQTYFIGLFGAALRADFALSEAALGSIYGASTLASGLLMFWLGALADRFALRRAMGLALALLATGALALAVARGPWTLGVALFCLRLGGQGLAAHFAVVAAVRYGGAARGRGAAMAAAGFLLGEAVFPLLVTAALGVADWRSVWLLVALLLLAVPLPLLHALARPMGPSPPAGAADAPPQGDWTRRKLATSPPFLSALAIVLVPPMVVTALFFHQAALAEALGWRPQQIAQAFVVYAACQGFAILSAARLTDRYAARTLLTVYLWPLAAGLLAVCVAPAGPALWLLFGGLGLTTGSNSVIAAALWAEVFGTRTLGLVRGVYVAVMVIGTAVAPAALGTLLSGGFALAAILAPVIAYALAAPPLLAPVIRRRDGLEQRPRPPA